MDVTALYRLGRQAYRAEDYSQAKIHFESVLTPKVRSDISALSSHQRESVLISAFYLGQIYEFGLGIPVDYIKARECYEIIMSNQNDMTDRMNDRRKTIWIRTLVALGGIYRYGCGVIVDLNQAKRYLDAAEPLLPAELVTLHSGSSLYPSSIPNPSSIANPSSTPKPSSLTPTDKVNSTSKTLSKALRSAAQKCILYLGDVYYTGDQIWWGNGKVSKNYEKALRYYELTLQFGDVSVLLSIGCIYHFGDNWVRVNQRKAREYFELAYAANNVSAIAYLAKIYQQGIGVNVNIPIALSLHMEYHNRVTDEGEKRTTLTQIQSILSTKANLDIFINDQLQMKKENMELRASNLELKSSNELLQQQVEFQPEGPGYLEAKSNFELLKFELNSRKQKTSDVPQQQSSDAQQNTLVMVAT